MNYYDEILNKINGFIADKDYVKAEAMIINELGMPYVPSEFEKKLLELLNEIKSNKNYTFQQEFDLDSYLHGDDMKQLLAIDYITKRKLLDYHDEIIAFLKGDGLIQAKELLIFELIEQQINLPLIYQKNQEVFEFNPINITPPTKSPFYLACDDKLNDYFMKNPDFYKLSKELLIGLIFDHLPLEYGLNECELIFKSIVYHLYKIFDLKEEIAKFELKYLKNDEKLLKL